MGLFYIAQTQGVNANDNNMLTYVIEGEPRHKVDKRLIMLDTLAVFFPSPGVFAEAEIPFPVFDTEGVFELAVVIPLVPSEDDILASKSRTRPCSANGCGSIPRLVNRSEREAKHRKAPSATCRDSIIDPQLSIYRD